MCENENIDSNESDKTSHWWITLPVIVVVLIWVINWITLWTSSTTERGTFGDMFGVSNALFSGLAFAGIIYTIALQRKELELQRRELRQTKLAMQKSAEAQIESEKALRMQVQSMQTTAKLNALSAILNNQMELLRLNNSGQVNDNLRRDFGVYILKMQKILDELEKENK